MRRLHVSRATGLKFGRFSERSIELGSHSFIVVHGNNESGKTTLSELIAWMIAGRHGSPVDTMKYGAKDDIIGGTVTGTFDGATFTASRSFRVRDTRAGRAPAEPEPTIIVGERSVPLATWEAMIAVPSGQDFALRYRITDSDDPINVRDLLESLAVGTHAGMTPAAAMNALEDSASGFISPPTGRNRSNAASLARQQLHDAESELADAVRASRTIDRLRERISEIGRDVDEIEDAISAAHAEKSAITTTIDLVPVRRDLRDAEASLVGAPSVPAAWTRAIVHRARTEGALIELQSAEREVRDATALFDESRGLLGVDPDSAHRLQLDPQTEREVTSLTVEVGAARTAIGAAEENRRSAQVTLGRLTNEFGALAADIGISAEEATGIASHHVDDIAFNDALSRWIEAAGDVVRTNVKVKPAIEREAARRRALEEAQRAWDALDLAVDPEYLHRTGTGALPSATAARRTPSIPVLIGAGTAIALASAINRWSGVAVALAAVMALVVTTRRNGRHVPTSTTSGLGLSEAAALVQARADHIIAGNALADVIGAHEMAEALNLERRKSALSLLGQLGITSCTEPEHAAVIRGKRSALVAIRREMLAADATIVTEEARINDERERLSRAETQLARISAEIGVPGLGSTIDLHTIARLRDVITQRDMVRRSLDRLGHARARVRDVTGDDDLGTLSADALMGEFRRILDVADARATIESSIATLSQRIELATSGRPDVRILLDSPTTSVSALGDMERDVDARLADLRGRLTSLTEELGAAKSDISALESRADLPDIRYRIEQARFHVRDATMRGVATWFARKVVADIKDEYERDNQPALVRHAGDMVRRATNGAWRGLKVSDDGSKLEVMWGHSLILPETSLSAGGRDLLRLAVRIAVADAHGTRNQVSLPLICDDPTHVIDDVRTPEVFALLAECSQRRQVIVMTPRPDTARIAERAGATVIDITNC